MTSAIVATAAKSKGRLAMWWIGYWILDKIKSAARGGGEGRGEIRVSIRVYHIMREEVCTLE